MKAETFASERISRSAEMVLLGPIETVFPLFGPLEEKKWEDGWNPNILFPPSGEVEEGMVFTTGGAAGGEGRNTWIVSKYLPGDHRIEYTVSTGHRIWVIAVKCAPLSEGSTKAEVRYTFTGLNPEGNTLNRAALDRMYKNNLKDWEEAINHYLKTGSLLKR